MAEETHKSGDDLPADVLKLIGSSLLAKDRISFRSVCRTWRSAIQPFPSPPLLLTKSFTSFASITPFPLLMYHGCDDSFYNFYHPIYNTRITINSPHIANAIIRFSKDGWLIMSRGEAEIFFYNPFIDERIDLPDLVEFGYMFATISFSSVPTSPDCTVFGVFLCFLGEFCFSFTRIGESEWTTYGVERKGKGKEFIGSHSNPVFHNGLFYYMDKKGLLGSFDPTLKSGEYGWTELTKPKKPCNSNFKNYLMECDGELVSVFICRKLIKIFKLDFATMTWKDVKKLEDKALFVSRTSSISATNLKQEAKGMENNIFFPRFHGSEGGIFYSLNSGKFHTLGSSYNSTDFCGTTEKIFCTWISPSQ